MSLSMRQRCALFRRVMGLMGLSLRPGFFTLPMMAGPPWVTVTCLATMLVAYADKLFTTQMAVAGGHDCLTPGFVEHCERMPS